MKVLYTLNNYQIGGKMKTTPTHKIISQDRISERHTQVVYEFDSIREKEFCDKVFSKNGQILD